MPDQYLSQIGINAPVALFIAPEYCATLWHGSPYDRAAVAWRADKFGYRANSGGNSAEQKRASEISRQVHHWHGRALNRKRLLCSESQKQKSEAHEAKVRLDHARAMNLEIDTAARQVMEAPIPGKYRISFEDLTKACSTAIALLAGEKQRAAGADND